MEQVQLFTGFETHGFAGRNGDFCAGTRVATDAGLAWFYGEDAEAAQLNTLTTSESTLHGVKDCVNGRFRLNAGKAGPFDDTLDKILFYQGSPSFLEHVSESPVPP